MAICDDVRAAMGPSEVTTFETHRASGLPHRQVIAATGWLRRRGDIEHVRDELCDPSLGAYPVGVYRRRAR
jgi:hypothetical protein